MAQKEYDDDDPMELIGVAFPLGEVGEMAEAIVEDTRRRDIMGEYVNRALTTALAAAAGVIIIGLNGLLLYQLLGGRF